MDEIGEVVETMPVGQSSVSSNTLREKRRRNVGGKVEAHAVLNLNK